MELSILKGVGPTRTKALHAAGIYSLRELLLCVPTNYKDLTKTTILSDVTVGKCYTLSLTRREAPVLSRKGKISRVTLNAYDANGKRISLCWFNQPWLFEQLSLKSNYIVYGIVKRFGSTLQLVNPSIENGTGIIPIYKPIEGLPQKTHHAIVLQALEYVQQLFPETLPKRILSKYNLPSLSQSLVTLHSPTAIAPIEKAQRRFAFEQMLLYQVALQGFHTQTLPAFSIDASSESQSYFWSLLPFSPTNAQRRTLSEICHDMEKKTAMSRLVQGDVGSGKTAVAMGAMLCCAKSGFQSTLMAPTEILARQHYEGMKDFFSSLGIGCGLLVGSMRAKEKREALTSIQSGKWQVVIGTHALFSKKTEFFKLALCITDEQHRFGVVQRANLANKGLQSTGISPHVLVMSATPIPRSLALVMYGDLNVSIIDELPPHRKPITTRLVPTSKESDMFGFIRNELDSGKQVYIVCTLVDEQEGEADDDSLRAVKPHARLLSANALSGYSVGIAYGTQPQAEQQKILDDFTNGKLQVLVASTIIEVGVNVPNATVMVIENADRLGLAQLHQLRGRVGRGDAKSWCFLRANPNERLRSLVSTQDGFVIAKADLEQRGPGELLGTRQHGIALLSGGAMAYGDMHLLYEVSECVKETASFYPDEWAELMHLANHMLDKFNERMIHQGNSL